MTAALACPAFSPPPHPEADLLSRLRAGDEDAYEAVVATHTGRLLAVARRFLRSEEDSADAVQEAFVSMFRALPSFRGVALLGTWLYRILVNVCGMKLRSRARRPSASLDQVVLATEDDTAVPLSRAETRARVRACIDQLPENHRNVLILRDIEGHDTETTAALLNIRPGAVKTRLHRARQALRRLLDPLFAEEAIDHPDHHGALARRRS